MIYAKLRLSAVFSITVPHLISPLGQLLFTVLSAGRTRRSSGTGWSGAAIHRRRRLAVGVARPGRLAVPVLLVVLAVFGLGSPSRVAEQLGGGLGATALYGG